ncbi:hypothetical protein PCE1_000864 [Barthelona sp. PCE]
MYSQVVDEAPLVEPSQIQVQLPKKKNCCSGCCCITWCILFILVIVSFPVIFSGMNACYGTMPYTSHLEKVYTIDQVKSYNIKVRMFSGSVKFVRTGSSLLRVNVTSRYSTDESMIEFIHKDPRTFEISQKSINYFKRFKQCSIEEVIIEIPISMNIDDVDIMIISNPHNKNVGIDLNDAFVGTYPTANVINVETIGCVVDVDEVKFVERLKINAVSGHISIKELINVNGNICTELHMNHGDVTVAKFQDQCLDIKIVKGTFTTGTYHDTPFSFDLSLAKGNFVYHNSTVSDVHFTSQTATTFTGYVQAPNNDASIAVANAKGDVHFTEGL